MKYMTLYRKLLSVAAAALVLGSLSACRTAPAEEPAPEPENEVSMIQTLTTPHGKMQYFRFGNPEGKPYVILPGLSLKSVMGAADAVAGAYAMLAEDYDMYLFDRITQYPDDYDIYGMAEDTIAAFDQLGLKDISVMGVSQGGMIAQIIAVQKPELISHLILCSTSPCIASGNSEALAEWQMFAEKKDAAGLVESFGRYVYTPEFFEQFKDAILAQAEGVTDEEFRNFLISLNGMKDFDIRDQLGAVTCPAFVLGAGEDRVLGVQASRDLMDLLHCDGYIYEGKGHGVYDEAPDYLSRVKEFLDKH